MQADDIIEIESGGKCLRLALLSVNLPRDRVKSDIAVALREYATLIEDKTSSIDALKKFVSSNQISVVMASPRRNSISTIAQFIRFLTGWENFR